MSRDCSLRAGRPATDSARAHSALNRRSWLWGRSVCGCCCFELAINWRCGNCHCDFVVASAAAKINEIRVVRVVKNAQKVSFAEALAVASEKLAGFGPNGRGGRCCICFRNCGGCALHEIEGFVASETKTGCADSRIA